MSTPPAAFGSVDELRNLVLDFERGIVPHGRWDHPAYLAVALWYLSRLSEQEATQTFIANVLQYHRVNRIETTRTGGYNETLTLFWLAVARQFLRAAPAETSILRLTNEFVRQFGHRPQLFLEFYSPHVIWSWKAHQGWVEPDLQPLDGDLLSRVAPELVPETPKRLLGRYGGRPRRPAAE